jgi:hypothetical protein
MAQSLDQPRSNLDSTVRVFDRFYDFDLVVDANQYEIVYSYFYDMSKSKVIARNFTTIIFRIANITGESAMRVMEDVKGTTKFETNAILTYYLNSIRSKSTLFGIGVIPSPNQSIQRNVVI